MDIFNRVPTRKKKQTYRREEADDRKVTCLTVEDQQKKTRAFIQNSHLLTIANSHLLTSELIQPMSDAGKLAVLSLGMRALICA